MEFARSKIDRLTKKKKDLIEAGDFFNIINIVKIKDNVLLDQRSSTIIRFKRAMKRMVILKRFSESVGYKFDATNFDISKLSMN